MDAMIRAGCMRGYGLVARRLGGDPVEMMHKHHIAPETLQNEDALVSMLALISICEESSRTWHAPDFGLQLAQEQDISILGSMALAIQHAPTVGDAIRAASRFHFIHSPAIELTCTETDWRGTAATEIKHELLLPRLPPARQAYDLGLGVVHRILSMATNNNYPLLGVRLPHTPLASPARYKQFFGVPVEFEQPYASLIVDRHFSEQPVAGADSNIQAFIEHYLEMSFPASGQTVAARVRGAIVKALEVSRAELESVSQMLAVHARKLQRDLAEEGTTFEQVRDAVRRDAAARYLTTTRMPLSQVSAALGFSEQSVLTRACKMWFGMTPLKYRRQAELS